MKALVKTIEGSIDGMSRGSIGEQWPLMSLNLCGTVDCLSFSAATPMSTNYVKLHHPRQKKDDLANLITIVNKSPCHERVETNNMC